VFGVAVSFFVMVFVANAPALLCFLKDKKKNKQVQPTHEQKTMPKKLPEAK
jgi:hypothetical protein